MKFVEWVSTAELELAAHIFCFPIAECTVKELKDRCRERGLPVSGVKSVLLERVQADVEEQVAKMEEHGKAAVSAESSNGYLIADSSPDASGYLKDLVEEYVHACGGSASSRNVGRYLAANKASQGKASALAELKDSFGSLASFVSQHSHIFSKDEENSEGTYAFTIGLRK